MAKPAAGQGASLMGAGFRRCHCGCLVLWDARTGEALTPCFGYKHQCVADEEDEQKTMQSD